MPEHQIRNGKNAEEQIRNGNTRNIKSQTPIYGTLFLSWVVENGTWNEILQKFHKYFFGLYNVLCLFHFSFLGKAPLYLVDCSTR